MADKAPEKKVDIKSAVGVTKEGMKKRYHESLAEMAAFEKENEGMVKKWQAVRDKVNAVDAEIAPLNDQMREYKEQMYHYQMEQAMIAKAVGSVGNAEDYGLQGKQVVTTKK